MGEIPRNSSGEYSPTWPTYDIARLECANNTGTRSRILVRIRQGYPLGRPTARHELFLIIDITDVARFGHPIDEFTVTTAGSMVMQICLSCAQGGVAQNPRRIWRGLRKVVLARPPPPHPHRPPGLHPQNRQSRFLAGASLCCRPGENPRPRH